MAKIDCVKTEKFEIEYVKFGNGKKIFVMIPGISIKSVIPSAEAVESAYSQFCTDYTIYLFDRKKHIEAEYSIEEMADDTYEAMKQLGLKDIYLFGASQGGMIAQSIAIKYPSIINAMIIASSYSRPNSYAKSVMTNWITLGSKGEKRKLAAIMAQDIYSEETISQYGEMLIEPSANASDYEIDRFVKLAKSILNFNVYDKLADIKTPTLVIGSQKDMVLTANASSEIANKIGCELYLYDGYSHAVYDEAPDHKDRIQEFFDKY